MSAKIIPINSSIIIPTVSNKIVARTKSEALEIFNQTNIWFFTTVSDMAKIERKHYDEFCPQACLYLDEPGVLSYGVLKKFAMIIYKDDK